MKRTAAPWLALALFLSWVTCVGALEHSGREALAQIHNRPAVTYRVPVTRNTIFAPEESWTYSHHPHVAWYRGYFYVMWSNGHVGEDLPGQRVIVVRSADFATWSAPILVVGPEAGIVSDKVYTASGFFVTEQKLAAYFSSYEYGTDGAVVKVKAVVRTSEDGLRWSAPSELEVPIVPNQGPRRLASGRIILPGHTTFPYTDDPNGISAFRSASIYNPSGTPLADIPGNIRAVAQVADWGNGVVLCEGSFIERENGVIWMFLRSFTDRLWVAESVDHGVTWSRPVATGFSDDNSRFHFGSVGDGRYWYVGNPVNGKGRNPLVFALSATGTEFDTWIIVAEDARPMRFPGRHKSGAYGYPGAIIRDGKVYVVASVNKEDIVAFTFDLPRQAAAHGAASPAE